MEFKIEVNIDWLEEGGNIDEVIKEEIKSGIINRIAETSIADLKIKASELASKKVEEWMDDFLEVQIETLKFPYGKADTFSRTQPEMLTIPEIMSREFQKALEQSVNSEGKYVNSSYDRKGTRLEWLTGKIAEKIADEKVQKFVGDFYKNMNAYFSETLKDALAKQISSAVIGQVDLNKVFNNQ
jgi:predicted transcriptional regulator